MERTRQTYVPIALFIVAIVVVGARVAAHFIGKQPAAATKSGELVQWVSLAEGRTLAKASGKPILYDFTAEWCQPCHMLDAEVFRNPAIAKKINEQFVPVRVTDRQQEEGRNTPEVAALQQQYSVRGFPTVVIADGDVERGRMEGFRGAEEFERVMERAR